MALVLVYRDEKSGCRGKYTKMIGKVSEKKRSFCGRQIKLFVGTFLCDFYVFSVRLLCDYLTFWKKYRWMHRSSDGILSWAIRWMKLPGSAQRLHVCANSFFQRD